MMSPVSPLPIAAFRKCGRLAGVRLFILATLLGLGLDAVAAPAPKQLLLDAAHAGGAIVAVGERGTIVRSTDNGFNWIAAASPTQATLTGIAFAGDGRTGWAAGHDGLVLFSADGGLSWTVQYAAPDKETSFLDVCALDARRVIVVGAFGICLVTGDGGATWTPKKVLDEDLHLNRITRADNGTLYLAGEAGTLLRSRDQGTTWDRIATPYEGSFYGILPLGAGALLAHGLRGHLYHSRDEGETWTAVPNELAALLATAVRLKNGDIVMAGQARVWLRSHDNGLTVVPLALPLTTAIAELLEAPDGALLAFGEAGATRLDLPSGP